MSIKIKVNKIEAPELLPEGIYKACVILLDEGTGQFGDFVKVRFEIVEGELKKKSITMVASKKIGSSDNGKTTKLFEIYRVLTGNAPIEGEELDLDTLKGKCGQIIVKNQQSKNGTTYSNIVEVMPLTV
jgi:hypothetical protein